MELIVLFVLASGVLSSGREFSVRLDSESVGKSFHSDTTALDPFPYPLGESSVKNPQRNRRIRDAPRDKERDLFGFVGDSYSYGNAPISSYSGSISPFWTFRTNNDFIYSTKGFTTPRERRRADNGHIWRRAGFVQHSDEDMLEAAGTELVEDEADPEPPKREEEFISEHEVARDVPTRPKNGVPGGWAKGEVPGKKQLDLGFVPVQIYSQIRRYDSEEHLPRERAIEEADNQEEILAAPRLREVLRNKKLHEVYEEEGYEDLGYDHGGYNHHGVKVEGAVKNEQGAYRKLPPSAQDADTHGSISIKVYSPGEEPGVPEDGVDTGGKEKQDSTPQQSSNLDTSTPKVQISGRRIMVDGKKGPTLKNTLRDTVKQNLTIYVPNNVNIADRMDIAETRSDDELESRIMNSRQQNKITFPGKSTQRHYKNIVSPIVVVPDTYLENESLHKPQMVNVHQVADYVPSPHFHEPSPQSAQFSSSSPVQFASTINTYASLINQNFSMPLLRGPPVEDEVLPRYNDSDDYTWTPPRNHKRKVKSDRADNSGSETQLEVAQMKDKMDEIKPEGFTHKKHEETSDSPKKQSTRQPSRRRGSSSWSTSTKNNNEDNNSNAQTETMTPLIIDMSTPPTRSSNRKTMGSNTKKDKIYSNFTRGNVKYNPEDDSQWTPTVGTLNIRHPSLPIDPSEDKSIGVTRSLNIENSGEAHPSPTQSMPSVVINIPSERNLATTKDPSANAKYVEQLTLAHFSAPVNIYPQQPHLISQEERLKELAKQLNSPQEEDEEVHHPQRKKRSPVVYSKEKYPHYEAPPSISKDSALKYATNPEVVPKKTYGGMQFYESKENIKCKGPHPPKNITPQKEADGEWDADPVPDGPRVKAVGDTIDCYKKKFFGRDPLDNPFFKEEEIETPEKNEDAGFIEDKISSAIPNEKSERRNFDDKDRESTVHRLNETESESEEESLSSEESYSEESSAESEEDLSYKKSSEKAHEISSHEVRPAANTEPPSVQYSPYYGSNPNKAEHLQKRKKYPQQVIQPISVYSIISSDNIPPHHAPLLIPETSPNLPVISYLPVEARNLPPHKMYPLPNQYTEKRIIVQKRETDNAFWGAANPLKWWWPALFDSRRDEPRYRRSAEPKTYDIVISNADRAELSSQGSEVVEVPIDVKSSTSSPLTLAEFKAKFNIPETKKMPDLSKKVTSRLTGGFLNRNLEITDHIELLEGEPTELSTASTIPTTTLKPKVIFPRAKLPRRKTYAPKKPSNFSVEITTEGTTTTTTTTTLPPSTTTRMYKPKRVLKKNYGKGPFDAFTILKIQRETTNQDGLENTEAPERKNRSEERVGDSKKIQEVESRRMLKEEVFKTGHMTEIPVGEPKITLPDLSQNNDTLTYMVNPVTGVGSWGEQRKWKPKRKRPNTPSVYSYVNASKKEGASRKRQRDIPDGNQQAYIARLMSRLRPTAALPNEYLQEDYNVDTSKSEERSFITELPTRATSRSSKPPPKYILEPNKRRYFYAKVR